jgi:lysyl-tRNA synthetase, class II
MELNEQEAIRRQKLDDLIKAGINPYPAELWPVNTTSKHILETFDSNPDLLKDIIFAGRIMFIRDMGKAAFAVLQDSVGKIQLYIKRDEICTGEDKSLYDLLWKKLIDIGDIIGVTGYAFKTKPGKLPFMLKS